MGIGIGGAEKLATLMVLGLFLSGIATTSGRAEEPSHKLSNLLAIRLTAGPNRVEHFATDGRPAIITLGWRDNGNAHGYDLYLVLMRPKGSSVWNVVGFETDDAFVDTFRDDPHTGDDFVSAVRFASGSLDGKQAELMLVATREIGEEGIPAPSPVSYEVYQLIENDQGVGGTTDLFRRVEKFVSTTRILQRRACVSEAI